LLLRVSLTSNKFEKNLSPEVMLWRWSRSGSVSGSVSGFRLTQSGSTILSQTIIFFLFGFLTHVVECVVVEAISFRSATKIIFPSIHTVFFSLAKWKLNKNDFISCCHENLRLLRKNHIKLVPTNPIVLNWSKVSN
jgi:hypothetical protein